MTTRDLADPFVPMRLLALMPGDGSSVTMGGAVLLADLANFTGLSEALAVQAGLDSGEWVSRGLNQALGPVVDAVVLRGGEVIKFSGDGLLCLFPGNAAAVDAALAAAREIAQASVHGPAGEVHRFRCATVHGPVVLTRIGGHRGRYELVAGGEAVDAVQHLVVNADPGTAGPLKTLPLPPAMPDVASPLASSLDPLAFLPAYVLARRSYGMAQWLHEFRTLTLAFAAAEPADGVESLQDLGRKIQLVVDGHGGQLLRFGMEGRRLVAEVAFGLVPDVAETGPREAAQCAIQLVRDIPNVGVGISTGRILLGPIGSAARRQLTALGSAVNVAARLMQAAEPGGVLADEATWAAVEGQFLSVPTRMMLKGLGERACWRLGRGDPEPGAADDELFGRQRDMALVCEALEHQPSPALPIVVQGEAGIGKSRFARWLAQELRARSVSTWTATGTLVGRDTPYAGLAPVIAELCGLRPGIEPVAQLRIVARDLLDDAERAPLLADALRVSMADSPATRGMVGAVRADNIRTALSRLFAGAVQRGAAALLVDDAHWLDASSWALLQRLAADVDALRLVIVTRPLLQHEPPPLQAIRARHALVLSLEPLSATDITAVIARRMAVRDVPAVVSRWVNERVRGNPFFAQELVAMLMAFGVVKIRDGMFASEPVASELNQTPLATTIESAVEQRIQRLGVEDAIVLKVASVLGLTFSLDALADLVPTGVAGGIALVAERLLAAEMVVPAGPGRLAFRHGFTQEAAYRMLPTHRRRELHGTVALRLEERLGTQAAERAGELAHHWFAAENRPPALRWLEQAGMQALHTGADREAATHFQRALSIGDGQPTGRLASWHRQLARALLGLGRVESVAAQARRALELVARPLPRSPLGWLALSAGTVLKRLVARRWARPSAMRPVDLLEGARAAGLLAEAAYFVNAPEVMLGSALLAVDLAERASAEAPVSVAYGMLGVVAGMARLHRTALRYLERARMLSESAGDPLQQGVAWFYAGMYYGCIGDWQASLHAEQRALAFTEALGAHAQSGFQFTLIATNALYTSEYENTRTWMAIVGERAERSSNVQQQGWANNVVAVVDLHQGRFAEAMERSERARQLFLVERDRISLIISEGIQCAALCRQGRIAEALATAERARDVIAGARPTTWGQLEGFAGPCEAYARALACGALTDRDVKARAAVVMTGLRLFALVFPFGRARYHWICALFDLARGRTAAARRRLGQSIECARRYRMPFEEMCATELLAAQVGADERTGLLTRLQALHDVIEPVAPAPALQAAVHSV
jgi:class 3 adenylate cyclase/tetratricopeptide (TPR) repeat protein